MGDVEQPRPARLLPLKLRHGAVGGAPPEVPAWVIAKGGITSSDISTKGLRVKRAEVLGHAIPGVPVWRTGVESRWPGLVYVVFPGNVGGPEAIAEVIRILRESRQAAASFANGAFTTFCGRPWR